MAENDYVVVFKDTATNDQIDKYANRVTNAGGSIHSVYYRNDNPIIYGFIAGIPHHIYSSFQDDDLIEYVEDVEAKEPL
ncbi:hypothetical protein PENFLA_c036G08361 [Penicillium flavigenum]|uniref:Inhibitor I9 domain-containing protein n=1 Tax=Penicillium flavigenum TaxID=254877 RepID=A0A1V6SLU0_9EURO|nr:hypothetical protein PENFLA_c036G08361 [Penicillium flavigenum]